MQFYLNGFRPGDPEIHPAGPASAAGPLPEEVDVLVVGTGPAGLVLAAQLAAFPGITTRIVERRPGPLELGQADGVACRSVEMFDAFGLSGRLMREGYWVNETVFWRPDQQDRTRISRSGRIQDVEDGLSEFPHLIVNQARIQQLLLDVMGHAPSRLAPDYGLEVRDLAVGGGDHPVEVTLQRTDPDRAGEELTVRARYVVGCDGARSTVRQSIGRTLRGDAANQAWGVMDVLAVTDFPDIRFKAVIQSGEGNIVLIPREGGYLVRFYIELDELGPGERVAARGITLDTLIASARRILHPYSLDVRDVVWWSVYEIGQRLTDAFDDVPAGEVGARLPRVFIAGDACHTHSPKAGQGMNVSMQDAFNLGWKLAAVLEGRSSPELLHTYSAERQAVAKRLIDFDRDWAARHSARPQDAAATEGADAAGLQRLYTEQGRFTAGVATHYEPSLITGEATHQHLATGFPIGERFHSAPVVRLGDARPMHLGHVAEADGRWRLYAFADAADPRDPASRIRGLCEFLAGAEASPVRRSTPAGADDDAVFDLRAVFQQGHRELPIEALPPLLLPRKGRFGLVDYEKAFCPDLKAGIDVFDLRGVDRDRGCLVVVRPDQYVAHVLPLDAHEELARFFAAFMVEARQPVAAR
ncbi:3-hydroxybenzoate 4-monooxygenase [Geodermatophilus sabuli]|uniref:3-hydroxybenzoate 4-monooxygenase n=1 Tax=Geodermatophilus sabuli TaxID=1564158 RepID=A0A7K3VYK1_9ACTN|nr:FAD-binding monooxygenase [Geodermatophilus sabuli]NEK56707.1 3-hydroxybenzoate 4-monooxygenase [Geodermatophilus sabuli]